jgi:hypothetical protein
MVMTLVGVIVTFMVVSLVVVFMTMPFVIVGVFFGRMVVTFVVMTMAFVAMTRMIVARAKEEHPHDSHKENFLHDDMFIYDFLFMIYECLQVQA